LVGEDFIPVASLVIVVSAILVLSCRQTDRHTAHTDAAKRLTPATVVGMSNERAFTVIESVL